MTPLTADSPSARAPSWAHRFWRSLYWFPTDHRTRRKYRGCGTILVYGDSLGDNLLSAAVARELRRHGRGPVAVISNHPELFRHNPNIDRIEPADWGEVASLQRTGLPLLRPDYVRPTENPDRIHPPGRHILAEMCASAGIGGQVELKPDFFFGPGETPARRPRTIALQSGGAGAGVRIRNKEWPAARFQAVVDALASDYAFVQLGTPADSLLRGVEDRRGRTTLREAAAILAACDLFVGLEGFLMHLARAVGRRSVIIYGGRVRPDQIGYPCNENLYEPVPCAPCWQFNGCEHDRRCLTAITADQVVAAARRAVGRVGPLETDVVTL